LGSSKRKQNENDFHHELRGAGMNSKAICLRSAARTAFGTEDQCAIFLTTFISCMISSLNFLKQNRLSQSESQARIAEL